MLLYAQKFVNRSIAATHDRLWSNRKIGQLLVRGIQKLVGGQSCGLVGRLERSVRCVSLRNVGQLKDRAEDKFDVRRDRGVSCVVTKIALVLACRLTSS